MTLLFFDFAHAVESGFERLHVVVGFILRTNNALSLFEPDQLGRKRHRPGRRIGARIESGVDCPVFLLFETVDFFFPLANQPEGYRLHPARTQACPHFLPQKRRDHVSHEPVQGSPCLLRFIEPGVEFVRLRKGFRDSLSCKLVEKYSSNRFPRGADLLGYMPGDCLSFPVRVRAQIDGINPGCGFFEFFHYFFLPTHNLVFRLEFLLDVDSESIAGKILDMPDAGLDDEVLAQIAFKGLRLGGRFNDQKRF